jgi:hypothetical protein
MSFILDKSHDSMQEAILKEFSKNIIIFAPSGADYDVTYPARSDQVICVYLTDISWDIETVNPTRLKNSFDHFATLGVGVKSAWPRDRSKPMSKWKRRLAGPSIATPIASGIAACTLEFARMHGMDIETYKILRSHQGIQAIFAEHMVDNKDAFDYIHPWNYSRTTV